ncbi:MAG: hypothetical protein ABIR17_05885 [Pseudolysinimonas sp.]|uniref:hypothetical protein n=1 Tax=Pseudolysinimonas sp. TaxID=2680009 RepID=UPI003264BD5B
MSSTLYAHPPHQLDELSRPISQHANTRRPTALDRLALHLGLLLITYGRRRYALPREEISRRYANESARHTRELTWARARHLLITSR